MALTWAVNLGLGDWTPPQNWRKQQVQQQLQLQLLPQLLQQLPPLLLLPQLLQPLRFLRMRGGKGGLTKQMTSTGKIVRNT